VVDDAGADVTMQFLRGALAALRMAQLYRVDGAILKSGSPSCGTGDIRDGSFTGRRRVGDGVAAALLKRHGITVYSEEGPLLLRKKRIKRRRFSSGMRRWRR